MQATKLLQTFTQFLIRDERELATVLKYVRDVGQFLHWLGTRAITKEQAVAWKGALAGRGYAPMTVNGKLAAINKLFLFLGKPDCRVKYLKLQRRMFRNTDRELNKGEYLRLLETAQRLGRERLALLIESICATGIRVSEVKYLTVEAVRSGCAEISLKGKIRTILIPGKLCRKLLKYAKKQKTTSGEIFLTRNGKSLSRHQIWSEMKSLCVAAHVPSSKVFPHNLRHLFARTFYRIYRDVAGLADVLGHSSVETTRLYLITTSKKYAQKLGQLNLIS